MGKIIYRTEKIKTAGEVSGREAEANRTSEDKGRFQNSDINWELTDSNYDFKITHNWIDAVKDLCKELGCPVKKDSVLVLDHLITASPEWMKAQTEETRMQFFEDAKQWIVDEFCGGDERLLLNCRIHKDEESNWHMCAATAPIMKNPQRSEEELAQLKRKSRQKEYSLNAKAIMGGREKYGSRQQSIEDKIGKKYGLEEREVREQGQAKKHRTVQQAKLDALKEKVQTWERHEESSKLKAQTEHAKVRQLKDTKERLQEDVRELRQTKVDEKKATQEATRARESEEKRAAEQKLLADQNEAKALRAAAAQDELVRSQMRETDASKEKRKKQKKDRGLKMWEKIDEPTLGMTATQQQAATGVANSMQKFFNQPTYTPEQIKEAEREAETYRQKTRALDEREANIDKEVETRVQGLLKLNNQVEKNGRTQMLKQMASLQNNHNYVLQCMKQFLEDHRFDVKEFEQHYGFSLSQDNGSKTDRDDRDDVERD